jgi:hypothetical protein
MFRSANLSRADRIRAIAAKGFTGYSFWSASADGFSTFALIIGTDAS